MALTSDNRETEALGNFPIMNVNPLTLKFSGELKQFEPEFIREYGARAVKYVRLSILLGIILYSAFGMLDEFLIPDKQIVLTLWFIRYAIVCPIAIIFLFISFRPIFKKYTQEGGAFILILSGSGISLMVGLAPAPATFSYYAGVILVLMLGYGFSKLRFLWATLTGWVNLIIYEIIAIGFVQTPDAILLNNNFFFISANIIGMCSCYAMEYYNRKDFLMARMLEQEQKKVVKLNLDLENKVSERTSEIRKINTDLEKEIEARNEAEKKREKLERELYQSQKMESIGNLAGGIAHDFNNILSSIMGYTELSLDDVEKGTMIEDNLQQVYTAGIRAKDLVRQILAFARQSEEKVQQIRLEKIIKEVLKFIRASIPSTVEIRHNIKSNSLITGNQTQVHQILMNLCTNSAHAMDNTGGILEVGLKDVTFIEKTSDHKPGEYVELSVSDTGSGIPPEIINSIFEPYFTTKKPGEGTGMGLAMIHGIVKSYNGFITVDSEQGKGSVFKIYLPTKSETATPDIDEPAKLNHQISLSP